MSNFRFRPDRILTYVDAEKLYKVEAVIVREPPKTRRKEQFAVVEETAMPKRPLLYEVHYYDSLDNLRHAFRRGLLAQLLGIKDEGSLRSGTLSAQQSSTMSQGELTSILLEATTALTSVFANHNGYIHSVTPRSVARMYTKPWFFAEEGEWIRGSGVSFA
jgi:hypothetical protein